MKRTLSDIWGVEHDWLACDGAGRVALFSTAGGGYAPPGYLEDIQAHANAISSIIASPAISTALFAPTLAAKYIDTWRIVAERGLYAFDSDATGSPYRLVAAPTVPCLVSDLTPIVARTVSIVCLRQLSFARFEENERISHTALLAAGEPSI
jgi:hypothetical protein